MQPKYRAILLLVHLPLIRQKRSLILELLANGINKTVKNPMRYIVWLIEKLTPQKQTSHLGRWKATFASLIQKYLDLGIFTVLNNIIFK